MKNRSSLLKIAVLAILMFSLVGCAEQKFERIGEPQVDGDKVLTAWVAKDRDPWGVNVSTIMFRETEHVAQMPSQPQCGHVQPQCGHIQSVPTQPRARRLVWVPKSALGAYQHPQYEQRAELPKSRAINFNNQGGDGWVTGFFKEGFAGLAQGAGTAVTGFGFRPSRVSMRGGGATASSSAASSAASSSP